MNTIPLQIENIAQAAEFVRPRGRAAAAADIAATIALGTWGGTAAADAQAPHFQLSAN